MITINDQNKIIRAHCEIQQYRNEFSSDYQTNHAVTTAAHIYTLAKTVCSAQSGDLMELATCIGYGHDLLKMRGVSSRIDTITVGGVGIPTNNVNYIRANLDVLEKYDMDDHFNSIVSEHALASAIFIAKELGITNKEVIYPIMFHSVPALHIYREAADPHIMELVDATIVADKLSSDGMGYHFGGNLVALLHGDKFNEFNFSMALFTVLVNNVDPKIPDGLEILNHVRDTKVLPINPFMTNKPLTLTRVMRLKEAIGQWQKR